MALPTGFRDYLFDVLAPLGRIEPKRMYGLDGIKIDGALLGFVFDDKIHFRTDSESVAAYAAEGGKPFTFQGGTGELIVTSYWSIPDRLIDEPDELVRWASRAREAALKAPSAVKRRARRARMAAGHAGKPARHPPRRRKPA